MIQSYLIRADSSTQLGIGHIMRCLTLADILKSMGNNVYFFCRDLPGNRIKYIRKMGYKVITLQLKTESKDNALYSDWEIDAKETLELINKLGSIDWVIVDNYGLDRKWEQIIKTKFHKIFVIDDMANRSHHCDMLLDQNLFENPEERYIKLVSSQCKLLLGPRYSLLRPQFSEYRQLQLRRSRISEVKNILIFFGGTDPTNETLKTVEALKHLGLNLNIVIGNDNPNKSKLNEYAISNPKIRIYNNVTNMAQMMFRADLALGTPGSASWERCCLGLPSILIAVAKNQENIGINLGKYNGAIYLGKTEVVCPEKILEVVLDLMNSPLKLKEISTRASLLVDGDGVNRVYRELNRGK